MGFLSPWFLAGLAALGLPFWLHLLRKHTKRPLPFSSLMFFEPRVQSSVKHRKLRHLLLLALRVAVLTLLALAFASPYVNRTATVANRRTLTIIAVDHSFSMRAGNRMAEAKREALQLVRGLPPQALVQVSSLDSHVENLSEAGAARDAARAAIESLEPSDRASSFGEFVRVMKATKRSSGMHLDVHLVSDMQQTAMPSDFHDLQMGPDISLQLHRVGERNPANWAVESVTAPASVSTGETARITGTVAGWNTPEATRTVQLFIDGKPAGSKSLAVSASGRAPVEFSGIEIPYGMHEGEVRLAATDTLPQDDVFPFAIRREDPRKVLFLYVPSRGGNEDLYYKTALESGPSSGLTVQAMPVSQARTEDFSHFAFIVLNDVGELEASLSDALCAYVEKGGGVFIALGENTARYGVIPLSKEQLSRKREQQSAGTVDSAYPALASAGRFENAQFFMNPSIVPKPDARVLARFADNSPLLVEERAGEGRKLILASALDSSTSDFVLHSSFVPFVVQTAHYLSHTEDNPSSVVAGTPVVLRQSNKEGTAADIIGPDGKHELTLMESNKALSYEVTQEGFYQVSRADGRRLLVAVHADRRESNLKAVPDETLDLWRNTGDTDRRNDLGAKQVKTEAWSFWRYVLIAALIAALGESIFADRYLLGRSRGLSEKERTA